MTEFILKLEADEFCTDKTIQTAITKVTLPV